MGALKEKVLAQAEAERKPVRLAALISDGNDVFCWCNRCHHNATVSARMLGLHLGSDHPVPDIGARMVCSACGARDIATRPAWPGCEPVTRHD